MTKKKTNQEIIDSYDYLGNAASTTDFTGLMPTPVFSDTELEAYKAIYPFYPPKVDTNNKKKGD